jgi:hypothetical protein
VFKRFRVKDIKIKGKTGISKKLQWVRQVVLQPGNQFDMVFEHLLKKRYC